MDNQNKVILDLCGGTGSWSRPYKDAGYIVHIITLPEFDLHDTVFNYDTREIYFFRKDRSKLTILAKNVYGILAAPTCTMFSMARTKAKTPRDLAGAMELVKSCLSIIFFCQLDGRRLNFWALENPKARLRWFLGKPAMTFQPFEFGDPHSKKTDIWGNFNTNLKKNIVELNKQQIKQSQLNSRQLPKLPEDYVLPNDFSRRAAQRSITPQGFAEAFFRANR